MEGKCLGWIADLLVQIPNSHILVPNREETYDVKTSDSKGHISLDNTLESLDIDAKFIDAMFILGSVFK